MYSSIHVPIPAVERIWFGDSVVDPAVGHRSDPVLGADLVFTFADGAATIALQGPLTTRRTYPHRRGARYVGVRFRPGFSALFGEHDLRTIRNRSHPLDRLRDQDLIELAERLEPADEPNQAACLIDALERAHLPPRPTSSTVAAALQHVARCNGRTCVTALAQATNVSVRQLQRLVSHHLGITPKTLIRLTRVQALQRHCREPNVRLAELAVDLGFSDQAHMSNEVRRVLFTTPAALARESRQERRESSEVG